MKILMGYALADVRKAITGGIVPALALLPADLADGSLSGAEIGGLAAAFVSGAFAVFFTRNRTAVPKPGTANPSPGPEQLY